MNDHLLDQADALMRRRSFIAGAGTAAATAAEPEAPAAADADADELDLPVLTDVVDAPAAAAQPPSPDARLEAGLRAQQEEFRKTLEAWLEDALPKAVAGALDGIGDYLVNELRDRARAELLPTAADNADTADTATDDLRDELRNDPL